MKKLVRIRLESRCMDQEIIQQAEGELYFKDEHVYVRYEEAEPELGRTQTTVKVARGQLKVIRHGDIQSEQTFIPRERTIGFYQTREGLLNLEVDTHTYEPNLLLGLGEVMWSYDLYMSGEHAGKYRLKLSIQEG